MSDEIPIISNCPLITSNLLPIREQIETPKTREELQEYLKEALEVQNGIVIQLMMSISNIPNIDWTYEEKKEQLEKVEGWIVQLIKELKSKKDGL